MSYSVKVIDHYENPRNVGSFGKEEEGVGTLLHRFGDGDLLHLSLATTTTLFVLGATVWLARRLRLYPAVA